MEVTAHCIKIIMNVFVLLSTQPGLSYTVQKPGFPIISPDRLQFFEYESLSVSCAGLQEVNASRVMRKLHMMSPGNVSENCSIPAPSCTIRHTFERHSGEYWCENDEGERSLSLNISVTAGPVILNIPAQPAEEGSDVTLYCITKNKYKSDFYKEGSHLTTFYKTDMTLPSVSKSDEGLYKCIISRAGESPESWLTVVKPIEEEEKVEGSNEEHLTNLPLILPLSAIFFMLFLVIGLILYKICKALNKEIVPNPQDTTSGFVDTPRRRKVQKVSRRTTVQYSSEQGFVL